MPLHVSGTMCSSSGGQNLYYTASGIITPIGGRLVHELKRGLVGMPSASKFHVTPRTAHVSIKHTTRAYDIRTLARSMEK